MELAEQKIVEKKSTEKKVEHKVILKPLFKHTITPVEILKESFKTYVPAKDARSGRIISGLSFEEEAYLLPRLINVTDKDPAFREKVRDYLSTFSKMLSYDGEMLDAGYTELNGHIEPNNIQDYILFKMTSVDKDVKSHFDNNQDEEACKFELIDLAKEKQETNKKFLVENEAMVEFVKVTRDDQNIDNMREILIVHNELIETNVIDIHKMDVVEAKVKLKQLMDKDAVKFMKSAKDERIKIKALIKEGMSYDVITSIGDSYYFGEEKVGETLGKITTYLVNNNDLKTKIKEIVDSKRRQYSR